MFDFSASKVEESMKESLKKLQLPYVDLIQVKFGLFEKHKKFKKNLPHCFDKSADLLCKRQNHEEDFFK